MTLFPFAATLLLLVGQGPAAALDLQQARGSFEQASRDGGHRPGEFDPPALGATVWTEADALGFRSSVLEYTIEAPVKDIWRLYSVTPLRRLLPSDWTKPTLRPYWLLCPDGKRGHHPDEVWPALRPGIQIQSILHWGPTDIHQDMDVTGAEPLKRIELRYAQRSPAEGAQTIVFASKTGSVRPAVRIIHNTRYRAKNPLYSAFYGHVHRTLLDSWHLGAKYYLESRLWAGAYCAQPVAQPSDPSYRALYARAVKAAGASLRHETFQRALCLYSMRFLGPASDLAKDEEQLARWTGGLAAALEKDEYGALQAYRRDAAADQAAVEAGARACR